MLATNERGPNVLNTPIETTFDKDSVILISFRFMYYKTFKIYNLKV